MLSLNSEFVAEADEIAFWNFVAKISKIEQYTSLTAKGIIIYSEYIDQPSCMLWYVTSMHMDIVF